MKRKLYCLAVSVWDADDYLNDRNTNPNWTDLYLYATREEAEKKAAKVDTDNDIYNDGTIYTGELDEDEILELTGFDTIDDFNEALAEPYSTDARVKNFGEDEKTEVARAIMENPTDEDFIECANYDFNKTLDGCILVFWSWERYIGYARKCIEVRRAYSNEDETLLTKQDKVFAAQCDILMTKEEVENADDLQEAIREKLEDEAWKWTNHSFVEFLIENF